MGVSVCTQILNFVRNKAVMFIGSVGELYSSYVLITQTPIGKLSKLS